MKSVTNRVGYGIRLKLIKNKWIIASAVLAVALMAVLVNTFVLGTQNSKLRNESVRAMSWEWSQLYRMSELVSDGYLNNHNAGAERLRLYVNQACHHFASTAGANELSVHMKDLLVQAYDPLFQDLSEEGGPSNKEKAVEILKDMNAAIMSVSKNIMDMQDSEKEKLLLDTTSSQCLSLSTQVKDVSDKYIDLVDNYYRSWGGK